MGGQLRYSSLGLFFAKLLAGRKEMNWTPVFFVNSALLGVGLAMDAFSVSLANGLNEPRMKPARMCLVAGVYGFFQIIMPLIGWFLVTKAEELFSAVHAAVPWVALILLLFIGGKMLIEGIKNKGEESGSFVLSAGLLLLQGISTSIDALSVGFTIAAYPADMAVTAARIIGIVTFGICMGGLAIGKKVGTGLSGKASILGGLILIGIGIEIFVSNVFF